MTFCQRAGMLGTENVASLNGPFRENAAFDALSATDVWKNIISHLWVNRDTADPCFGTSDTKAWEDAESKIPADVVGVEITADRQQALIYVSGIPDYTIETPLILAEFKPGNIYGVYRLTTHPVADERPVHDFASKGPIGFSVNGASMFNYTDTFTFNGKDAWTYDANAAEPAICNSDIAHSTPQDFPPFPKSLGIFHGHQVSQLFLTELNDPFALGQLAHSKLLGFAIDSNPIYGPIGYTSKDQASGLKMLKSSYVKRRWTELSDKGASHRSSIAGWVILNWDKSNEGGESLLNLSGKRKADLLYTDGAKTGPVTYSGRDANLAAEIKLLDQEKGLKRDSLGYVYWESGVTLSNGTMTSVRNYLLKSSDLWGPDIGALIVPVPFQLIHREGFIVADVGIFAEDYEYVPGYGDLDFFNGTDSYLPDRAASAYHYVTPFDAKVTDADRKKKAMFPYYVGIQFKSKADAFNDLIDQSEKVRFFRANRGDLTTVFDLGTVGKAADGKSVPGSVPDVWQREIINGN